MPMQPEPKTEEQNGKPAVYRKPAPSQVAGHATYDIQTA